MCSCVIAPVAGAHRGAAAASIAVAAARSGACRLSCELVFPVEGAAPLELDHAKHGLAKDAAVHLAGAQHAVDKHDGHLYNLEAHLVGGVFHLDLEGIALKLNLVEVDALQHLSPVAHKAGCGVVHVHAGDDAHIL